MEGWIKLHRKIVDWEWWEDVNTSRLFLTILLHANHEPKQWRGMTVNRGQFVTSLDALSRLSGLSVRSVRTSLNKLKKTSEVTCKTTSKYTVITVCCWEKFQKSDTQSDNQETNDRQTTDKQTTTTKNDKNDKNDKKYIPGEKEDWIILGEKIVKQHPTLSHCSFEPIKGWLIAGISEDVILQTIDDLVTKARVSGKMINTFAYFEKAMVKTQQFGKKSGNVWDDL